jgi:hypothetical protein
VIDQLLLRIGFAAARQAVVVPADEPAPSKMTKPIRRLAGIKRG